MISRLTIVALQLYVVCSLKLPKKSVFLIDSAFSAHEYLREGLIERGWTEARAGSPRWEFHWAAWLPGKGVVSSQHDAGSEAPRLAEHQLVNHFINFENITTKHGLLKQLLLYQQEFYPATSEHSSSDDDSVDDSAVQTRTLKERPLRGVYSWFPRAYDLSNDTQRDQFKADALRSTRLIEEERRRALEESGMTVDAHPEYAGTEHEAVVVDTQREQSLPPIQPNIDGSRNVWIAKPASGTRGVGIRLFDSADDVLEHAKEEHFVVQKYVEAPLLIRNRKFDIRQFVLVTSLKPLIAFVHDDCYLRFCSERYSITALDRPFAHLTNAQVQKDAPKSANEAQMHWSLAKFRDYLQQTAQRLSKRRNAVLGNRGRASDAAEACDDPVYCNSVSDDVAVDVWTGRIRGAIDAIVRDVLRAWPQRAEAHRNQSFELLGLDILLDRQYRPYLLEVNANPGMHLLSNAVRKHHAAVVKGMLAVLLDNRATWQEWCRDATWRDEHVGGLNIGGFRLVVAEP